MKCYFTGYKESAVNRVQAKWRADHIFCTCAGHAPGAAPLPPGLPKIDAYIVTPIKQA